MDLSFSELKDLVAALSQSDIAELTLKSSAFELTLRKPEALLPTSGGSGLPPVAAQPAVPAVAPAVPVPAATVTTPASEPAPPPAAASDLVEITSPMVGTFYRAPAPDEPAFVSVGERIRQGQTVCIIEAMKLMNELEAEVSGEVVEILVENANPVEFGQVLMLVRPA